MSKEQSRKDAEIIFKLSVEIEKRDNELKECKPLMEALNAKHSTLFIKDDITKRYMFYNSQLQEWILLDASNRKLLQTADFNEALTKLQ
jgi:hypothetical protein